MSLSYVYLILAILCVSGLGISHKVTDLRGCKPTAVNMTLFAAASLMMWIYTIVFKVLREGQSQFPPFTMKAVVIAAICGLCACFGILTFQNGVRYGRITTSWLIVNLSALLPTAMSFIIYDEFKRMKWQHPVALVLTTLSVFLLWKDKKREASPLEVEPSRASTLPQDHEPLVSAVQE